ncbi:peptidase inhibitor family I36 protein [Streptomyces sp. T-3]|nr:peptidase inhibitor family I36 protein [Streptomyces sp. T-3]
MYDTGFKALRNSVAAGVLATALLALTPAPASGAAPPRLGVCGPGELCLWGQADFKGPSYTYELTGVDIESCTALPEGSSAQALANRTGRPVTTYQSAHCEETGEFATYPGSGTWAPQSPYRVRAFKLWER